MIKCYNQYGDNMKKLIIFLLTILLITLFIFNNNKIKNYAINTLNILYKDNNIVELPEVNDYITNDTGLFVELTTNFIPENRQELLNIYYTALNMGWEEFTFHCKEGYDECINDLQTISKNDVLLSDLNNRVHPYNSFSNITTSYLTSGKITIFINHLYTEEEITLLENYVNKIINKNIKTNMTDTQKIKVIHDYIINNTKYDSNSSDANKATSIINSGYSQCSGYTDLMSIFLNELDIKNIKISSSTHIWNLVNLNNKWYHLDLTWDDPVTTNGKDILSTKYFLISTDTLRKIDKSEKQEHIFDEKAYPEAI